jgi:hypothetical protein
MRHLFCLAASAAMCVAHSLEGQSNRETPLEHGVFVLHDEERVAGRETYAVVHDGNALKATVDFNFANRGRNVPLSVTFRGHQDWTPIAFDIRGNTSRFTTIDQAVEVRFGKLHVRSRSEGHDAAAPQRFFTIAGYAPTTMQMLLRSAPSSRISRPFGKGTRMHLAP